MLKSKKGLKYSLGYSYKELCLIVNNIDKYYSHFYREETKANGQIKKRHIEISSGKLKKIQKSIKEKFLAKFNFPDYVHGGIKEKSNITNARVHQGKKFHFCTDLKNFFPSINHKMVFNMFLRIGFSPDIASIFTKLTTYKGHLPQGLCTSPYIANLVFLPIDKILVMYCQKYNITYTRYFDDLSFSSPLCFKKLTLKFLEIIKENDFKISHRKTSYKIGPATITGVLTKQNSLCPTDSYLNQDLTGLRKNQIVGKENYIKRIKNA